MKRIRVIAVKVQPELVLEEDGELGDKLAPEVIEIPGREWPTYSSERFPREIEELEKRLNEPEAEAE